VVTQPRAKDPGSAPKNGPTRSIALPDAGDKRFLALLRISPGCLLAPPALANAVASPPRRQAHLPLQGGTKRSHKSRSPASITHTPPSRAKKGLSPYPEMSNSISWVTSSWHARDSVDWLRGPFRSGVPRNRRSRARAPPIAAPIALNGLFP
jgi:hypothetical protein